MCIRDRFNAGKLLGLPDEDLSADMYIATQELCDAQGLPAYEVSNHARSGQESRHNMVYWQGGDYVGIGPGAHGRLTDQGHRYATETYLSPAKWLAEANERGGTSLTEMLEPSAHAEEYLMMALRTVLGADLQKFEALRGSGLDPQGLAGLVELGLLSIDRTRLVATTKGRPVLNSILATLLAD